MPSDSPHTVPSARCVGYRGHTILVAQHVVPIRLAVEGEVRLDASFKDVGSLPSGSISS